MIADITPTRSLAGANGLPPQPFREFVLVLQDQTTNLSAINYRNEPMIQRYSPTTNFAHDRHLPSLFQQPVQSPERAADAALESQGGQADSLPARAHGRIKLLGLECPGSFLAAIALSVSIGRARAESDLRANRQRRADGSLRSGRCLDRPCRGTVRRAGRLSLPRGYRRTDASRSVGHPPRRSLTRSMTESGSEEYPIMTDFGVRARRYGRFRLFVWLVALTIATALGWGRFGKHAIAPALPSRRRPRRRQRGKPKSIAMITHWPALS